MPSQSGNDDDDVKEAGAAVVGLNCHKGCTNIMRPLRKIREACKVQCVTPTHCIDDDTQSFCQQYLLNKKEQMNR